MGGAVSAGENNDELIDNLVTANYITSEEIEEVFRAVDRGFYYLQEYRDSAYHDLAWRHDHLHISAPCIYSKVLSYLDLKPGLSFLNIGSGTGYFSTLAGLILGSSGINHGIELHGDVVSYAKKKVDEFILQSPCFDRYTFCKPQFVVGNCLHIAPESPGYDRIYCGAACPPEYESFMKNLLNQNGVLIMPSNDQLQVITRTGLSKWETSNILVVSFATLVVPPDGEKDKVAQLPLRNPQSLYELCRFCIRQVLSKNFHHGSNRRFKRKRQSSGSHTYTNISIFAHEPVGVAARPMRNYFFRSSASSEEDEEMPDREENSPMMSSNEDSSSQSSSSDDPQSKTPKSGSILDISTGTLITFGDNDTRQEQHSSASSQTQNSSSNGSSQSCENDDRRKSSRSIRSRMTKGKLRSVHYERSSTSKRDEEPKRSKAKKGWDLIRRKFKNRKKEKSVFSKSSKETLSPSTADDSRLPGKAAGSDKEASSSSTRENANDVRPPATRSSTVSQVSLRSFVMGVATQLNNANPHRSTLRDGVYSYLDRRIRQEHGSREKIRNKDLENEDDSSSDEIVLSNHDFYSAILALPLPEPIKLYLLFYRCLN